MSAPKEIWIDMLAYEQGLLMDYIGKQQQTVDDLKYLSESHHNEIVDELKRENARLREELETLKSK